MTHIGCFLILNQRNVFFVAPVVEGMQEYLGGAEIIVSTHEINDRWCYLTRIFHQIQEKYKTNQVFVRWLKLFPLFSLRYLSCMGAIGFILPLFIFHHGILSFNGYDVKYFLHLVQTFTFIGTYISNSCRFGNSI